MILIATTSPIKFKAISDDFSVDFIQAGNNVVIRKISSLEDAHAFSAVDLSALIVVGDVNEDAVLYLGSRVRKVVIPPHLSGKKRILHELEIEMNDLTDGGKAQTVANVVSLVYQLIYGREP